MGRDYTGLQLGLLTVQSRCPGPGVGRWTCRCACGGTVVLLASNVRRAERLGTRSSCGCLGNSQSVEARRTHSKAGSVEYRLWSGMLQRCTNPQNPRYAYYGGRGIKVDPRWLRFEGFYKDMGDRPPGMTLDRIDNAGDYTPGNVRWATMTEQARNRRDTKWIEFRGERLCQAAWAQRLGIRPSALERRLSRWPLERALTEKPRTWPEKRNV